MPEGDYEKCFPNRSLTCGNPWSSLYQSSCMCGPLEEIERSFGLKYCQYIDEITSVTPLKAQTGMVSLLPQFLAEIGSWVKTNRFTCNLHKTKIITGRRNYFEDLAGDRQPNAFACWLRACLPSLMVWTTQVDYTGGLHLVVWTTL